MKHTNLRFNWKIGGEAGFGIKSAGLLFAKALMRAGYETYDYSEYPSLIRGGHNTYQVTISEIPLGSVDSTVDVLVALNQAGIDKHLAELIEQSVVICDASEVKVTQKQLPKGSTIIDVPFKKIIAETGGGDIMRNTVAMGATMAVLDLPINILEDVVKELFKSKPDVIESNVKAMDAGFRHVKDKYKKFKFKYELKASRKIQRALIPGNEALAMGALVGGMNFFAAYPMTPSSSIMMYLANKAVENDFIFKHAEDEISVINMALGAAHVGARAMVATSGGGFALMGEGLGLAGVSETPLVLVNVQRPGPATGMPTWSDQGDLQFILHAGQGEFPRIILAPGDVTECFYMGAEAMNLAEKYQMPVIILSDKVLAEGSATVPVFEDGQVTIERGKLLSATKVPKNYKRYKLTDDGISPRALPGMKGGVYWADSYEHSELGFSSEDMSERIEQVDKRSRKLAVAAKELSGAKLYGSPKAKTTIVGWGSVKGPILDAINLLPENKARQINFLHLNVIWPLPSEEIRKTMNSKGILTKKRTILIENNSEGQLGQLIRQETGLSFDKKILRYDGRPFFANELAEQLKKLI
jgi:2-oxoglutarate ferredoxin oxidoreductase subunit alpha